MIKKVKLHNGKGYYESKDISHSFLTILDNNPEQLLFEEEIDRPKYKYESLGTAVHHYVLEQNTFWDNYIMMDEEPPTSKQQKAFVDECVNGTNITEAYRINYETSKKSEDKISSEALKLYDRYKSYIDKMRTLRDDPRISIGFAQHNKIKTINDYVYQNENANHILSLDGITEGEFYGVESITEQNVKAKIDKISFDDKNKIVYVIDLKSFSLPDLKTKVFDDLYRRVEHFNYGRQLAYYGMFVKDFIKGTSREKYDVEYIIIFVQTEMPYSVRVFKLPNTFIIKKQDECMALLKLNKEFSRYDFDYKTTQLNKIIIYDEFKK